MADRSATLKAVREKYPQYADMADDQLGSALAAKYPEYADLAPKPAPAAPIAPRQVIPGAIAETFGYSDRPGSVPLTGTARTKTPLGVLAKPSGLTEHLVQAAVTGPLITIGGEIVPIAWLGRAATTGGIETLKALASGAGLKDASLQGLLDLAVAAGTEGLLSGAVKLPKIGLRAIGERVTSARKAYEWATRAPAEALEALKARLPKGKWLNVPTVAKGNITADEAIKGLQELKGYEYQQARGEIISEFNRLDIQSGVRGSRGPRPYAGQAFNLRTSPERFAPPRGSAFERAAISAQTFLEHPATRAAADVLATEDVSGMPAGVVGGLAAKEKFGDIAKSAVRHLIP